MVALSATRIIYMTSSSLILALIKASYTEVDISGIVLCICSGSVMDKISLYVDSILPHLHKKEKIIGQAFISTKIFSH